MLYEKNVVIEEKIPKSNGEILTKRYLRGRFLGKGGFSRCYEVTEMHSKKVYAAKIISKSTLSKNKARQKVAYPTSVHKPSKTYFLSLFPRLKSTNPFSIPE